MELKLIYSAFEFWGGITCLTIAFCIGFFGDLKANPRIKYFVAVESLAGLMLMADSFAWGFRGVNGSVAGAIVRIANFIAIFANCWIPVAFFPYLCMVTRAKNRDQGRIFQPVIITVSGFLTFVLILSQFNGMLYRINSDNTYERGPFMVFALAISLVIIGFFIYQSIRGQSLVMTVAMMVLFLATAAQIGFYGHPFSNIVCAVIAIFMFAIELVRRSKRIEKQWMEIDKRENAIQDMQTRIALSQIRPHFLYNALNSIYVLCGKDLQQGRKAISDLSDYLRANIGSIDSKYPIAFTKEMEHVEKYLSLEKLRFPEELSYTFITPVTDFSLPALTIQPLVENAVRHGIMQKDGGGLIIISTRETERSYIVSISDNGEGFDTNLVEELNKNKDSDHIGIRNVRERLKRLSDGELEIHSDIGIGTEAVIRIPK